MTTFLYPYGGVVYKYNDVHIKLATPYDTKAYSHSASGGIAYTGGISNLYHGPNHLSGPYVRGFARVRAWKEADMPDVLFSQTINMSGGVSFLNNSNIGLYESLGGVVYAFDDEMVRLWVPTLEGLSSMFTNGEQSFNVMGDIGCLSFPRQTCFL
ncbi:POC1 [Mytilus edulis]|uniref:POC1 n=1 Tax=Mytilus edulis TaxID=6550 RepID=A0A8S3QGY1_MYTED|nr:POC1 [Mytilus edulis]